MGQDKAVLQLKGRSLPMAAQVASVLAAGGCSEVFIVGRQDVLHSLGVPVVPDPDGVDHHPLWGVVAALRRARAMGAPSVVIAPCDLPDLDPLTIGRLLDAPAPAVGETVEQIQPLLAHVPIGWSQRVEQIAQQGRSVRHLWSTAPAPVQRIAIDVDAAHDLDSRADVAAWSQQTRRER